MKPLPFNQSTSLPQETAVKKVSLIVPVYNEEEAVSLFMDAVDALSGSLEVELDVIFVDDGSRDSTREEILKAAKSSKTQIRLITLSRNFGKEAALTAGIDAARGDAVIPIDVDLQDPPELIIKFIQEWEKGYKIVYGRRIDRCEDSILKRITSYSFYTAFNFLSMSDIPFNAGDFRLMDRCAIDALGSYRERTRFMKGLFSSVGFESTHVDYKRPARKVGTTKWNYWKLWNFALDGLFSFSTVPLRIWTYVGIAIASLSFFYAVIIIAKTLLLGQDVPGYASLITVILFMGGTQLVSLGIIGEYVSRIFWETKQRPIYTVDHSRSVMWEDNKKEPEQRTGRRRSFERTY
jgi:glycosyltransferase involved in cell wall biosynthesis